MTSMLKSLKFRLRLDLLDKTIMKLSNLHAKKSIYNVKTEILKISNYYLLIKKNYFIFKN